MQELGGKRGGGGGGHLLKGVGHIIVNLLLYLL